MYPDYEMNNVPQQLTKNITGLGYQIRFSRWNANVFGKMYRLYSSTHKLMNQFTEEQNGSSLPLASIVMDMGLLPPIISCHHCRPRCPLSMPSECRRL